MLLTRIAFVSSARHPPARAGAYLSGLEFSLQVGAMQSETKVAVSALLTPYGSMWGTAWSRCGSVQSAHDRRSVHLLGGCAHALPPLLRWCVTLHPRPAERACPGQYLGDQIGRENGELRLLAHGQPGRLGLLMRRRGALAVGPSSP